MYRWKNPNPSITFATADEIAFYNETEQYANTYNLLEQIVDFAPNDWLTQYHFAVASLNIDKHEQANNLIDTVLKLASGEANEHMFDMYMHKVQALVLQNL